MTEKIIAEIQSLLAPDPRLVAFTVRAREEEGSIVIEGEVQGTELKTRLLELVDQRTGRAIHDRIAVLPEQSLAGRSRGVINVSVAGIHRFPTHSSEIATQALLGAPVAILKKQDEWFYVQLSDGYIGWADDTLAWLTDAEFELWSRREKVIVTADHGLVRSGSDPAAEPVGDVVAGNVLAITAARPSQYQVSYPDGRTGYIARPLVEPLDCWVREANPTAESVVATARRFMGVPYLWGGASAKALDCSGLVRLVFFLNGVMVPRDADQQALCGDPVETGQKRFAPGDLLFFGTRGDDARGALVRHVAISLGGARFIQASGDVNVRSLDPGDPDYGPRWAASLVAARRVIGSNDRERVRRLRDIPYYGGTR